MIEGRGEQQVPTISGARLFIENQEGKISFILKKGEEEERFDIETRAFLNLIADNTAVIERRKKFLCSKKEASILIRRKKSKIFILEKRIFGSKKILDCSLYTQSLFEHLVQIMTRKDKNYLLTRLMEEDEHDIVSSLLFLYSGHKIIPPNNLRLNR